MMESLFRAVRESCSPATWSKGVELARKDAVTGDRETDEEVVLRVKNPDTGISPVVTLYTEDEDWQCTCRGADDPCQHVAAAVIALRRASEQGQSLPRSQTAGGRLVYRLRRRPQGLELERYVWNDDGETKLDVALSALTSGRVKGPPLSATSEDMEIEVALDGNRSGVLPAKVMTALCKALARVEGVTLEGAAVTCRAEAVGVRVVVADEGPGVKVYGEQDPDIVEIFANGCALCKNGLRPVSIPQLAPREQEIVRKGRFFGRQELAELASEILPSLEDKLAVDVRTTRLPGKLRQKPRLELSLVEDGGLMTVEPAIVYGDPVTARVKYGRLQAVGDVVPLRDVDAERVLRDKLSRDLGLDLDQRIKLPATEAVAFVQRLGRFDGDVVGGGLAAFAVRAPLRASLEVGSTDFAVSFVSDAGGGAKRSSADPALVLAAWQAGESLVPLLEGGYAPLPKDWLARFGDKILALLSAKEAAEAEDKLPRAALPQLAELCDELDIPPPPGLATLREQLATFEHIPSAELPRDLTADLRHYQIEGVNWLSFLRGVRLGGMLADDMGLGKTLQALTAVQGRTLVVAPTSVIYNWLRETQRFRPALRATLYHGSSRALDPTADIVVTTYAILRLDLEALRAVEWDTIILDEAQTIKNPDSQVARAARQLRGKFRVSLSGTPVENRLDDLYSQMQFVNPGLLGTRRFFQDHFARPIQQGDEGAAEALRRRIKPFLLRRLKSGVAKELPPRTDTVLNVELSPSERKHYDAIKAATRADVLAKLQAGGGVLEALEALLRLRQACCHPDLLPGIAGEASAKLALLVETLQEALAEGHKALVFSQWTSYLDLMEPALVCAGIDYLRLDGSTPDRDAVVRAFQDPNGPATFIMSLKAGGVGLNLTAADHVLIMDPWWNPAAEDQAADRAHRIGQDRPVLVQRLVALDTVEERILQLQDRKRALAESVVGTGSGASAALTREDLLGLLA